MQKLFLTKITFVDEQDSAMKYKFVIQLKNCECSSLIRSLSQIFETFPSAAAIFDDNNDSILDCVVGERVALDPDARTSIYNLTFQPQDGEPGYASTFFYIRTCANING